MIAQPLFQRPPTALPGYQRPGDWLPITDMSATEGFSGLVAVWNDDANFCAFRCQGAYTVDWGDGASPENFANGVTAYHNFAWADYDASTLTSRGYRQAVVTVTPQSGSSLTNVNLHSQHNSFPVNVSYNTGWLDLEINTPNATALIVVGSGVGGNHRILEQCRIHSIGNVNSMLQMFDGCSSLQNVPLFDTSNVTNMQYMFRSCSSLREIPLFDTSNVTSMAFMFSSCFSLQQIPLFDTSSVTNFSQLFPNCSSLQSVPALDMSAGTNFSNAFGPAFGISRVEATGISRTVSFASCQLSAADLDEIYTNLATVSGQTITVTGNYGTSGDDPTIATAKGWTVTG